MKLERKALLHYLDQTFGGATPTWFLIGKDIEEMSVEMNPDVETKQNILGEASTKDNGYAPQISADPYYANPTDGIYEKLIDITMNRKTGDACKTKILEVVMETEAGPFDAWQEDVIVKPVSYGGGVEGVNIPYTISFDGNRKAGTVAITAGVPVFTETT